MSPIIHQVALKPGADHYGAYGVVLFLALAAIGCTKGETANAAAGPATGPPVRVATGRAVEQPITRFIRASGTLKAQDDAEVAAEIAGRVIATPVERGMPVRSGADLVRIAATEVEAQAQEADANVAQIEARLGEPTGASLDVDRVPEVASARATHDLAKADFARTRTLFERKLLSQAEFELRQAQVETTRQQYETARNGALQQQQALAAARARATLARKAVADTVVRAPFDGVVAERLVSVGDYVTRGTKVASVMRIDPLRVELTVPAQHMMAVAVGRAVSFSIDAYPGETFTGQVRYVSPDVRADSRALVVEAVVPNPAGRAETGPFRDGADRRGIAPAGHPRAGHGNPHGCRNVARLCPLRRPRRRAHRHAWSAGWRARRGHDGRQDRRRCRHQQSQPARRRRPRRRGEVTILMQALAALCVRRPVFASVLILSLVVVGTFGFTQLGVDRVPNVDIPTITVTTRLPGAAPEQIESEITDKVEEAVNTISGIDQLSSNSAEGISQVIVTFRLDKNADVAAQEVRDRLNRIMPLLPRTITQPTIEKQDPDAQPILTMALTANKPIREITEYADKVLRRRFESADGVGQVLVLGGRKRQINVWLDAERLRGQNLTVNDVARALQTQNVDIPGGLVERGAQTVTMRTRGRVDSPEEFGEIVIRDVGGHPVRVNDVARVEDGESEAQTLASLNGEPTVMLQIRKQSGTNTVQVVHNVKERLEDLRGSLPDGYAVRIVRDQSEFIEASISSLQEHLVVGSLLASLVVLLFLGNLRSTVIAAISIPTSIVATFGLVWYMGFTLNMLTMLALTLAVGIVIDDAIVVLENIYRFIEEKGMPPMRAAVEATKEIGLAVMATTLSLVAIFVPVGFMGGMVGRFMKSFGLTMAFAVMVSLLVAFTLTPMMSARWLKVKPPTEDDDHHVHDSKHSKVFGPIDRIYTRLLEWSMAHRGIVAVAAVLGTVLERTALPCGGGELHAAGRHIRARGERPDTGRHEPRGDRCHCEPLGERHPADPGGRLHDGHRGWRRRGHAEHCERVYEAQTTRGARS